MRGPGADAHAHAERHPHRDAGAQRDGDTLGIPSPSATPTARAEASEGEMTGDQAIEVCLRLHDEYAGAGESLVPTGAAQVYDRTVEPHWLVLIPASNSYGPGYIQCILGGTYADPVHTGVGEMVSDIVTDEYIERTRTVNDGI